MTSAASDLRFVEVPRQRVRAITKDVLCTVPYIVPRHSTIQAEDEPSLLSECRVETVSGFLLWDQAQGENLERNLPSEH